MTDLYSTPSTDPGPQTKKELAQPDGRLRKYWKEIEAYGKKAEPWHEQAGKIVKMYLDQHRGQASPRRFALLWSNIETLKPAVYGKIPTVLCSRRYKDAHPVGRIASEILERATNCTFDLQGADEVFRMVRDDRLLTARGQAWVRYEAGFEKAGEGDNTYDKLTSQKVCIDYVYWPDFGHNVSGTWKNVWLVWRKVRKTKDEAIERFGEDKANKLVYTPVVEDDTKQEEAEYKAVIYEVWDKRRNTVVWISKECPVMLDEGPPPLNFRDFFPCPEPCYGSKASKSLIPTPDYRYYQDQAQEIDDLTEKIANLTDYLMLRAFVPAGPSADGGDAIRIMIQALQDQITSNKSVFVPVESWAGFAEKGGAKGLMDWLPLDLVIEALKGAIEARNQLVQDVYQITGISDILRGQTDPNETLGAQEIKSQAGSRRVRNAKDEIARFTRDIAMLVAEVIAEQFQPRTLADMTGFAYVPSPPTQPGMQPTVGAQPQQPPQSPSGQSFNDDVIQLLRDDRMRGFLIDIETDSTVQPDEDAEKQRRTEFITGIGAFLTQAGEIVAQAPALAPMITEMLLFVVRGFRVGRSMEEIIERSMQAAAQQMMQKAQQPDPKLQAEQAKAQLAQQKGQMDMQAKAADIQGKQALNQQELEIKQQELQLKREELEIKRQELQLQLQADQQKMALESHMAQQKASIEQQSMERQAQADEQAAELSAQTMQQKHDMGLEMMAEKAKQAKQKPAKAA